MRWMCHLNVSCLATKSKGFVEMVEEERVFWCKKYRLYAVFRKKSHAKELAKALKQNWSLYYAKVTIKIVKTTCVDARGKEKKVWAVYYWRGKQTHREVERTWKRHSGAIFYWYERVPI